MARSQIRLMVPRDQIALGAVGLLVMFAGGWLFWYFAVRPHHPSSYSLFEIAILPVGLLAIGILCVLVAAAVPPARARSQRATYPEPSAPSGWYASKNQPAEQPPISKDLTGIPR
jgi:hypothetical protein